ncbi:hypothetical protein PTI98_006250 [Pleurotus ostreatus]|nr:hypothetical protein PTI98_006250 [Pleurotus ostreatus]
MVHSSIPHFRFIVMHTTEYTLTFPHISPTFPHISPYIYIYDECKNGQTKRENLAAVLAAVGRVRRAVGLFLLLRYVACGSAVHLCYGAMVNGLQPACWLFLVTACAVRHAPVCVFVYIALRCTVWRSQTRCGLLFIGSSSTTTTTTSQQLPNTSTPSTPSTRSAQLLSTSPTSIHLLHPNSKLRTRNSELHR